MKAILLIGVGEIGLNQITWAREEGFFVIAADRDPEAPALELADLGVNISATDTRALAAWALENRDRHNICAVYAGNDLGVFSATAVARALDLDYLSLAAATRGLSKSLMKECWLEDGIPTPRAVFAHSLDDARRAIEDFGLPVLFKPLDSSGSQGIRIVRRNEEIEPAYRDARAFTRSDQIIVEQFVEGRHIDGNAYFWQGEFVPCGLSERIFSPPPYRVPVGGFEPSELDATARDAYFQLFEEAARSLGINHGPLKSDFILGDDGLQVIEISPRFHGDVGTSHITRYRTGSSHLQAYFRTLARGEVPRPDLDALLACETVCGWRTFDLRPGRITNLEAAAAAARRRVEVANVFVRPRGPREMTELRNNNHVAGFVWAVGAERDAVGQQLARFLAALQEEVAYED